MSKIEVLTIHPLSADAQVKIRAVDAGVRLTDAGGWFAGEIRETWPPFAVKRNLSDKAQGSGTREERDELLSKAEIIYGGFPFPLDPCARAPNLKWFHQFPAGASNLMRGDIWKSHVTVTTSRGLGNTRGIAEYAVASILHFAKGLHRASVDRERKDFEHSAYRPVLLQGKTACVVGAGGIGLEVGQLCAVLGLRVIGTRRSVDPNAPLPPGFDRLGKPEELGGFLSESDFVIACCQWTPETTNLFDDRRFAAMKHGSVFVNIARGEIVDEEALVRALESNHLRGAALDVYVGEFERPPPARLWSNPNVLISPHISAGSDQSNSRPVELFCENLRAYIDGKPLRNVIDWDRGY